MEKDKEVAKQEQGGAIVPRISGVGDMPAGGEEVDQGDLKMPRLAIQQGLSELVNDGKARMGDLAHSITHEVYGQELQIIPLFMFKSRAQFEAGRGLVMMSRDNQTVTMGLDEFEQYIGKAIEEVPGSEWEGKEPPKFSLVYNFPVLIAGRLKEFPVSLSLMKTATKAAKDFISMCQFSGEDWFARVYTLKTKQEKGEKGTYAVPVIEYLRRCNDEEYLIAKKRFDQFYRRKKDIAVDLESTETVTE